VDARIRWRARYWFQACLQRALGGWRGGDWQCDWFLHNRLGWLCTRPYGLRCVCTCSSCIPTENLVTVRLPCPGILTRLVESFWWKDLTMIFPTHARVVMRCLYSIHPDGSSVIYTLLLRLQWYGHFVCFPDATVWEGIALVVEFPHDYTLLDWSTKCLVRLRWLEGLRCSLYKMLLALYK
jgi:hypothetical protein